MAQIWDPSSGSFVDDGTNLNDTSAYAAANTAGAPSTPNAPVFVMPDEGSVTGYTNQYTGQPVNADGTSYIPPEGFGDTPPPGSPNGAQVVPDETSPSGYKDSSTGAIVNADGSAYTNTGSNSSSGINGLLAGISKATGIPQNLLAPTAITTAAGVAALLGGNKTKTALDTSSIPTLNYVNQQLPLGQAGQGQAFFTPGQYVTPANVGAAQANAANQAAIMTPPKTTQAPLPAANINTSWQSRGNPVQANTPFTNPQQPTGIQQIATPQQLQDMQSKIANMQNNPAQIENLSSQVVQRAHGGSLPGTGIAAMAHGRYLQGHTDGMADKIDTSIDGVQPAKLSHGEFIIPADVVSHLGNGNSDAGAKKLYQMMDKIRLARTGTKKQGKEINPDKFMPGGIAGYATGGDVKHFATGSTPSNTTAVTSPTSVQGLGTSTEQGLSNYIAPYVTNMLGQEQALVNSGMPVYTGELTAGPSQLQQQQFANASQLAATGLTPTQFTSGTFDANAAQQYMNPYLQASLNPQLAALQRTAQQGEQADLSKLTQAGAYGGTRQAVLQGQDAYNLLAQQGNLIGQGYNTAYNNAMNQFNQANSQSLQAQQNQEAANEAAANYGLATNQALGTAGATQQGLQQAADTASLNQFNQQVQYPQTLLTDQASMLAGLPVASAATTPNTSTLANIAGDISGLTGIYQSLAPQNNTNSSGSSGSSGTTGTGGGTTSDMRAKENIELIDVHPDGFGIYEFEYKPEFKKIAGYGRYRGYMAHEVEKVYPNAVITLGSGYKAIKYAEVPA